MTASTSGPDSSEGESSIPESDRGSLLAVARQSIAHGLRAGEPLEVVVEGFTGLLRQPGASFITLTHSGQLRGCVGSAEAYRPLIQDVAQNAYAAAFRDPRFPPLGQGELEGTHIGLSILGPPELLEITCERDLLAALRPTVDGLILEEPPRRALFLPQVWESLPDPVDFLANLKAKAGLPPRYWSDRLHFRRFTVVKIDEPDAEG